VSEQYDFDRYVAGLEAMFQQLSQKRVRKLRAPRPSEAVPTPVKMAGGLERACLF
jgi:hypothetical protein